MYQSHTHQHIHSAIYRPLSFTTSPQRGYDVADHETDTQALLWRALCQDTPDVETAKMILYCDPHAVGALNKALRQGNVCYAPMREARGCMVLWS